MIESAQGCSNRSVFGRLLLQTDSHSHKLWLRWESELSANQKVSELIPNSCSLRVEVSLSKVQNVSCPRCNVAIRCVRISAESKNAP